jgi:hypothetical protein
MSNIDIVKKRGLLHLSRRAHVVRIDGCDGRCTEEILTHINNDQNTKHRPPLVLSAVF